jgi:hypothetical protein
MKIRALPLCFAIGVCVLSSTARGQELSELRIRLDGPGGTPVSGALVALLNAGDSVVAEGLSSETGSRILRAPSGVYQIRVRRIGYRPFVSNGVSVPHSSELVLNVESARVVLESIVVNSKSQCKVNDPNSRALATVWDEIDKALRSSQLTTEDLRGIGQARTFRAEVGPEGTVISADTTIFSIEGRRPFGAIDPDSLASSGYVLGDEHAGWSYFAPDETVLRSDQFAATHCFRLKRQADRRGQIGVLFEPTPQRRLADIEGVLWVDQATSELREVVFRFVNAGVLSRFDAGGFTRFRRVPSGTWIVNEWKLSVPKLESRERAPFPPLLVPIGRFENGGGIIGPAEVVAARPRQPRVMDTLVRKR